MRKLKNYFDSWVLPVVCLGAGCLLPLSAGSFDTFAAPFDITNTTDFGLLQQYSPNNAGTLTGVSLVVTNAMIFGNFHVDNQGAGAVSITGAGSYRLALTLPGVSIPFFLESDSPLVSCSKNQTEFNTCSNDASLAIGPFSGVLPLSPTPDLSAYIGDAVISVTFDPILTTGIISQSPSNGEAIITGERMTGTLALRYTYDTPSTQAPEPTTMFLLGGGLFSVGLLSAQKRRRIKK